MDEKLKIPPAIRPAPASPATVKATEGPFKRRVAAAASAESKAAAAARRTPGISKTAPPAKDPPPPFSTTEDLRPAARKPSSAKLQKELNAASKSETAGAAAARKIPGIKGQAPSIPKSPGSQDDFMAVVRKRAQAAESAWEENHKLFRLDADFAAGNQWPAEVLEERRDRVVLTINQLPKFIRQVLNDGKQNRLSIKVSPIDGDASVKLKNITGTKDYTLAQVLEGAVRNIESASCADISYDTGLEHVVTGGFGWLKVEKRYARPEGFEQELVIRPKRNPFAVLYDPEAMLSDEPHYLGGRYAFEQMEMPRKDAEDIYGSITEFSQLPNEARPWWGSEDTVRLCRYWYIEDDDVTYCQMSNGSVLILEDAEAVVAAPPAPGLPPITIVTQRPGTRRCVYWCDVDGGRILTNANGEPVKDGDGAPCKWDGAYIPLIPILGPSVWRDGRVVYESLIRHSHDAQRMYNYWRSAATEAVALAPKTPWVLDEASVSGLTEDYKKASSEPVDYVRYRHREGVPPPSRVSNAGNPAAEINQSLQANDDIKGTVGLFDASIGQRSNEVSGKAIQARQREGDVGTFNWHDSLARAIQHVGTILVDLIPRIYDTERIMRLRTPDDEHDFVLINQTVTDADGSLVPADLGMQRYDVAVSSGPALGTQRQAAAESQLKFLEVAAKVSPQHAAVLLDKVAAGMDWQNAHEISERLLKMVPKELLEPGELENLQDGQENGEPKPPTPQEQQAQAAQEIAAKEAEAAQISAQAELINAQAKLAEAQAMSPENVKELVAQALAEILSGGNPSPSNNGATLSS